MKNLNHFLKMKTTDVLAPQSSEEAESVGNQRAVSASLRRRLLSQRAAWFFAAGLLLASAGSALANVHYVDVNSTNATPPYTNWTTAATNIQDAVDSAVAGDEIVVTNGTYATGERTNDFGRSRLIVDKPLTLRSVNGPQFTVIRGFKAFITINGSVANVIRCIYLTNGASLSGFTLSSGGLAAVGRQPTTESKMEWPRPLLRRRRRGDAPHPH